eukprot:gb/GEZN01001156.1/.p1 GENE.gb/GEZN01001156.1/~~gb/GEZN01001156.1/.p1  ORF type:complete len:980 (-),score=170.62 gb/GEZN01001156.1/:290-3229(-)
MSAALLEGWKEWKEWGQQDKATNVLKFYYEKNDSKKLSWTLPSTDWRKFMDATGCFYYVNTKTKATSWDTQSCLGVVDPFCSGPAPPPDDFSKSDMIPETARQLDSKLRIEDATTCGQCGKAGSIKGDQGVKLMRCGNCKRKWYCSQSCQKTDWTKHQQDCKYYSDGDPDSPSASRPSFKRPPPRICEECETSDEVSVYCPVCDQWICEDCETNLHSKGARKNHQRVYREEAEEGMDVRITPDDVQLAEAGEKGKKGVKERRLSTLPNMPPGVSPNSSPSKDKTDELDPWAGSTGEHVSDLIVPPLAKEPKRPSVFVPAIPMETKRHKPSDQTDVTEMEDIDHTEVIHEGVLKQKGSKGMVRNAWKERYYVLFRTEMVVYQNKRKAEKFEKSRDIPLSQISEVLMTEKGGQSSPYFQLVDAGTGKVMQFSAGTPANCEKWVSELQKLVQLSPEASTKDVRARSKTGANNKGEVAMFGDLEDGAETDAGFLGEEGGFEIPIRVQKEWKPYNIAAGNHYLAADPEQPDAKMCIYMIKKSDRLHDPVSDALKALSKQDHPNILQIQNAGFTSDAIWAIYPKPGNTIAHFLNKIGMFPERAILTIASQLVLALEFLHERHLTANTLSTTTVFLDAEDGRAVLGDVLLLLPAAISAQVERPEYICPDNSNSNNGDWWRLGVTLYEMAVGMPPFVTHAMDDHKRREELAQQREAFEPEQMQFPAWVSAELQSLIQGLLRKNKSKRLGSHGAHEVQSQAFFKNAGVSWHNVDASLNTWLNDNVVDHETTFFTLKPPEQPRWKHNVTMELISASNLPVDKTEKTWCMVYQGTNSDMGGSADEIKRIKDSQHIQQTDKKLGQDPNWGKLLTFQLADLWNTEVTVDVMCMSSKRGGARKEPEKVGSVTFPVHTLQSAMDLLPAGKALELNSTIIGPDGMTCYAELQTTFHLTTEAVAVPPRELEWITIPFRQTFANYFIPSKTTTKRAI